MPQTLRSTRTLVWLAFVLPLLALIAAEFQIGCSESGCPFAREIVGALVLPLLLAWLVVMAGLVVRLLRRGTTSRSEHGPGGRGGADVDDGK